MVTDIRRGLRGDDSLWFRSVVVRVKLLPLPGLPAVDVRLTHNLDQDYLDGRWGKSVGYLDLPAVWFHQRLSFSSTVCHRHIDLRNPIEPFLHYSTFTYLGANFLALYAVYIIPRFSVSNVCREWTKVG